MVLRTCLYLIDARLPHLWHPEAPKAVVEHPVQSRPPTRKTDIDCRESYLRWTLEISINEIIRQYWNIPLTLTSFKRLERILRWIEHLVLTDENSPTVQDKQFEKEGYLHRVSDDLASIARRCWIWRRSHSLRSRMLKCARRYDAIQFIDFRSPLFSALVFSHSLKKPISLCEAMLIRETISNGKILSSVYRWSFLE